MRRTREVEPPRGLTLALYRAPIWLYRLGLGRLMGGRFLLLEHRGRRTGQTRYAVVEVIRHDADREVWLVASGWGETSNWYRNLRATPRARIQVGGRRLDVDARPLAREEAEREMLDYGHRNPRAARFVAGLLGYEIDGTDDDLRQLGGSLPMLELAATPPRGDPSAR